MAAWSERRRRAGATLILIGTGILVFFGWGPVSNRLWWWLESGPPDTFQPTLKYDAVVMLGGVLDRGWSAPGQPPSYGQDTERLLTTFELLRSGQARVAIISGGTADPVKHPDFEAKVLARQLATWGIDPAQVLIEGRSINTRGNAVETARIVADQGFRRVLVVTSAFHMQRALGCFRAVGLAVDTLSVDRRAVDPSEGVDSYFPRSGFLDASTEALREFLGRAVYRLNGYSQ